MPAAKHRPNLDDKVPAAMREGQIIEFTRRTVIGQVEFSEFGSTDVLTAFFTAVERDSRGHMNAHSISTDHYEMTDNLGVTTITVTHKPHGVS